MEIVNDVPRGLGVSGFLVIRQELLELQRHVDA